MCREHKGGMRALRWAGGAGGTEGTEGTRGTEERGRTRDASLARVKRGGGNGVEEDAG